MRAQVGKQKVKRHDMDRNIELLRSDPLYLARCQVDTPTDLVKLVWDQVGVRRDTLGSVVDFGAGDARFSKSNCHYDSYLGYEVDKSRSWHKNRASRAKVVTTCAFSHHLQDADLCIGNPPYVRNQDLPKGWRQMAAKEILTRTGVRLSGLANAWQYFLMLAIWSVKSDGLVAQVLPFEWVSRPASKQIREFIDSNGWSVDVYRLIDGTFTEVLTAASITIIDKNGPPRWRFFEIDAEGVTRPITSPTGSVQRVLPYRQVTDSQLPKAKRGLSPGTQKVLTLTEGERVHAGLHVNRDVVRCITSLRHIPFELDNLTTEAFDRHYLNSGAKCWLIRTDKSPSNRLKSYLDSVDEEHYQTATCLSRDEWWRFSMPQQVPEVLVAQAFKGMSPKILLNDCGAHAVGGVAGIYNVGRARSLRLIKDFPNWAIGQRLVPYANHMMKIEINQINSILSMNLEGSSDGV